MDSTLDAAPNGQTPSRATMDRVRRVFIESLRLNIHEQDLPYEQKLDEVAGLDSIAVLEFVAALEKEFSFEIEPERLELGFVRDLPQLASYVEQRLAGLSPGAHPQK
jgi:acyl carrier protein